MITLEQGIDAFCSGFSFTRSFTHPYEVVRTGNFWQMRDGPRKKGDRRSSEVVTTEHDAELVLSHLRGIEGERLFLCVLHDVHTAEQPIIDGFKSQGCRLTNREPMMVKALNSIPGISEPCPISRVVDADRAAAIAKAARSKQILLPDIHDGEADLRLFAAWDGETPIGWVRSIKTSTESAWVSNMFVKQDYRRRGIGKSLMVAMLRDDQRYGFKQSVLLASHSGTLLYETVGYERIGTLLLFDPKLALE